MYKCSFFVVLINWGSLPYAMMTYFLHQQSNLVSCASLLSAKNNVVQTLSSCVMMWWGASGKSEDICVPLLFCLLCWPYFNADDAENNFSSSEWWHVRIDSYSYQFFLGFWLSFEVSHSHMLSRRLGLLWYLYSVFIQLSHLAYRVTLTITCINARFLLS